MEPLGAAASVIAVVEITGKVFKLCETYYSEVKGARKNIQSLRNEVISLRDVLENVADLAKESSPEVPLIFSLLNQQDGPVEKCKKDLKELFEKLDAGQGETMMRKFGLRALKWPFSIKEVEMLLTTIERHKTMFNLALTADHFNLNRAIKGDTARLNNSMTEVLLGQRTLLTDKRREKIHQWLSPPDPSSNHNAARKKWQPTTGAWFVEGEEFEKWKASPNSVLWLHGIPGCGKTVLCSTIIHKVMQHCQPTKKIAVTYFYFDFNDSRKQSHEDLLRSLIEQLSVQLIDTPAELNAVYSRFQDGQQQPTADALTSTLQHMLKYFDQTFIILDALDECKEREELLGLIKDVVEWKLKNLHVLATSRRERDIEEALEPLITEEICIQSALVNADIHTHICELLRNDPKLKKWPANVQEEIEKTLMDGSHGMFRWVVCQLDALKKCLKLDKLRKALKSLPKTLDATYTRILDSIDDEYKQDAIRILQWLAFSARPLRLEEAAEVIAVNIDDDPRFDPEQRLLDPRDILTICSSLVTITTSIDYNGRSKYELRLAHFSVKEYLVSERSSALQYNIKESPEDQITRTCLIYLLQFTGPTVLASDNVDEFPLAKYAAQYWTEHARAVKKDTGQINQLSMELFQSKSDAYINWIRLFNLDMSSNGFDMRKSLEDVPYPLYYASLAGLVETVKLLLREGADVNAQGGEYGNALQAAAVGGYEAIATQLLEKGADINAQGGEYGNALQAAAARGHEAIVIQLLEKGADVNAQCGYYAQRSYYYAQRSYYGNALQAAAARGHGAIVTQLLDKGANVNAQGGEYGNALQAAAAGGHEAVARQLLDKGADVNAQGGYYGNALEAAAAGGHEAVARQLLDKGADVNAQGGYYGNALEAATAGGHKAIATQLLEKGADINAQGGEYGNALQAAAARGHEAIVIQLLEEGADINAQCGWNGDALRAATAGGNEAIVTLIKNKGADVDAQGGGYYGNALQAAAARGHEAIVTQLLDKGADVNAQGGGYGNALQAAAAEGHEVIVTQLLEMGADVDAQCDWKINSNALTEAAAGGHEAIVTQLLEKGADVNAQGGWSGGNALQAAAAEGHEAIVTQLLEKGADVNAQGHQRSQYGNALKAAAAEGHEAIVTQLLEEGADVNAKGGWSGGNALQAAAARGHEAIVIQLLEEGADVNAQGGRYGSALEAAAALGHEAIFIQLLQNGAAVNTQGGKYGSALEAATAGGHKVIVTLIKNKSADAVLAIRPESAASNAHGGVVFEDLGNGEVVGAGEVRMLGLTWRFSPIIEPLLGRPKDICEIQELGQLSWRAQ